ncbi:hypothetical protein M5689_010314 [Euphorbia peplus]|nr:hypothetical protein M5689_010314 [Euphorbia peplus]
MVCFGDYNEILYSSDKKGGQLRDNLEMESFNNCISGNDLVEIDSEKLGLTWYNGMKGEAAIWEHLDWFMANPSWLDLFPNVSACSFLRESSDHNMIMLTTDLVVAMESRKEKLFRFE